MIYERTIMKIAILSMQRIVNIGSVLQAYSLKDLIREETGIEAEFLDIEDQPSLPSSKDVRDIEDYAGRVIYSKSLLQRGKRWMIRKLSACTKRKIRAFMREELKLCRDNNQKQYDHVVIGSDEVFNHSRNIRLQLHGEVRQAKNVISYAASCGTAAAMNVAKDCQSRLKKAMEHFSAVSVRDAATAEYVSHFYNGFIDRHLDPVLAGNLYQRKPRKVPLKKYLLVYAYGYRIHSAEEIEAIQHFAKVHGLKTVAIGGSQFWCDLYIPVSPFRALDYFYFADYVVTDTFHGAIFSIINHRQFAVMIRKSNIGKLTSLLIDLDLEGRSVKHISELSSILDSKIDYKSVDEILAKERVRTRQYLKEHLEGNMYAKD